MVVGSRYFIAPLIKYRKLRHCPVQRNLNMSVVVSIVNTGSQDIIVLSVYRPGSQAITSAFFDEFTTLLESLVTFRCPIILLGDLSIHLERK